MSSAFSIDDLRASPQCVDTIGRWHFDQWGPLTGAPTLQEYLVRLEAAAASPRLPAVLVAYDNTGALGSVSLVPCDLSIRPALTPWLAQLFVTPTGRGRGIGAALVRAALKRARDLGFSRLHLYTSGDLPRYYERLGWSADEQVEYLGKLRTVMHYNVGYPDSAA
jgi:predicted N-acetyltransferase YhbS